MIRPFQFALLPRIIFRQGALSLLPDLLKTYGSRVVLVTGEKSFLSNVKAKELIASPELQKTEVRNVVIGDEPSPEAIDRNVIELRSFRPVLVVAAGGGSVMDAGKAISAMLTVDGSVFEYLEGVGTREHPGTKIPFIAIPTTSGTGSEATKNAVISRTGNGGFKRSLRHENFVPDIALVDPELTLDCPPGITAASGMDCFTQLLEAYLSTRPTPYTDALAVEGLNAVKNSLYECYADGENVAARSDMSFAALTSGICLANAGLGTVHGFASAIGGLYNIRHGVVCGTLMAETNKMTVRKLRMKNPNHEALKKYAFLGSMFGSNNGNDDFLIDSFIDFLEEMTSRLELPGLKTLGVEKDSLQKICSLTENKNNPVALEKDELIEIIENRFI